ncbi:MAG: DNA replication/repair protein RecF [Chloroflexi bacterium]|nr:DNA replication/repair protein RecF [Chloroflexota bacterium]
MYLSNLSLTHFRNYQRLDLAFHGPITVFQGPNAQGKTNLLEAIYFLATSKSVHAQNEREVVGWQAKHEPIPYSRIAGQVRFPERTTELEIVLTSRGDEQNFAKQIKINGVPKRSMDLVGLLRAVLFLPEDVKLVDGSPGERRRYLDIALCQIDRVYYQALVGYNKVLAQRNSLLKHLRDQNARPTAESTETQLNFWDEKLVQHGSVVMARRHNFVLQLEAHARERHTDLSSGGEALQLHYVPSFNPGHLSEIEYIQLTAEHYSANLLAMSSAQSEATTVATHFLAKLRSRRSREVAAGNTLYGPHRDDLRFVTNGRDLRAYGSRGQQRTAALSLKLAELKVSTLTTGVAPLLLLDDVMSELDAQRRSTLLAALDGVEQAIITTTDWDDFTPEFRARAQQLQVRAGTVQPLIEDEG